MPTIGKKKLPEIQNGATAVHTDILWDYSGKGASLL